MKPSLNQHPVHFLFEEMQRVCPYPQGVTVVPEQIHGTSFFPGGTGLWHGKEQGVPSFPTDGVMILGHDFHSVAGYEWSRQHGEENLQTPTWLHLLKFLSRVPIQLEDCFFTNIYMGLREGKATTGRFPGATSPEFVKRCQQFFLLQVATQRPSLILALGAYVPAFLAPLASQLAAWATPGSFRSRDERGVSVIGEVVFPSSTLHPCVVASIVHPSLRLSNVRYRRWGSLSGDAAEVALVQEAVSLARVYSCQTTDRVGDMVPPI